MPLSLTWTDIALRLALTILAGILLGYNRAQHGKPAGMSTLVLVCLAASVAMIQVNLLLPMAGRGPTSFVMNDLMRFPLGILTGVGFIGAGAILRRDDIVVGVTTAATLWLTTVIGLSLGGGQIGLGVTATLLGLFALWVLKAIEHRLKQEHRACLSVDVDASGPGESEIRRQLAAAGLTIVATRVSLQATGQHFEFDVCQVRVCSETGTPAVAAALAATLGVTKLEWRTLA
jgi:putative Mg2+ transporter-C (MgtC) family protein